MLGTSTVLGNFSDEGKVLFSRLLSSRYFPRRRKLVAKVQDTRKD